MASALAVLFLFSNSLVASAEQAGSSSVAPESTTSVPVSEPAAEKALFAITFYDYEGQPFGEAQQVEEGGFAAEPQAVPALPDGKEFAGWFAEGSETAYDFASLAVQGNLALYARYQDAAASTAARAPRQTTGENATEYTVTFVADSNENKNVPVAPGAAVENPGAPGILPEGMVAFRGWFAEGSDEEYNFASPVTGNLTLTARFSSTWLVQYKNGGQVVDSHEVAPGAVVPTISGSVAISPPEGQRLMYWYVEGDASATPFVYGTRATADLVLVPHFSNTYYVYFVTGGSDIDPQVVTSGSKANVPSAPTKIGFTFRYWSATEGGAEYSFNTPVTADLTLYAVWNAKTVSYKIVYWMEKPNIAGDAGTDKNNYQFAASVDKSGVPAGSALSLTQAQVEQARTSAVTAALPYTNYSHHDTNVTVLGNGATVINVYYKRTVYTLNFDLYKSGATLQAGNTTYYDGSGIEYSFTAKYEQDISNLWPTNVRHNNSAFGGWKSQNSTTSQNRLLTKRLVLTSDLIPTNASSYQLNAKWDGGNRAYTVKYFIESINGNVPGAVQKNFGGSSRWYLEEIKYTETIYLSDNDNFGAKKIDGVDHVGTDSKTSGQNRYYSFYYTRNSYTLSFNTMGGSAIGNQTLKYGAGVTAPTPPTKVQDGVTYVFDGWYIDAEYNQAYNFSGATMPASNLQLFAKWKSTEFTVTYYDVAEGASPVATQTYGRNEYVTTPEAYIVGQGYEGKGEFLGWYYYSTSGLLAFNTSTPITKSWELHASWKTGGFSVSYDLNGAGGTTPVDGNSYTLDQLTRLADGSGITPPSGKIFIGWAVEGDTSGKIYYANSIYKVNSRVTFVAQYGSANEYVKIHFVENYKGSQTTKSFVVKKGQEATLADGNLFVQANAVLTGWSANANGSNPTYALGAAYTVGGTDVTLYGIWEATGYSVSFTAGANGSINQGQTTVFSKLPTGTTWGSAITVPAVTADPGYYFAGWSPSLPESGALIESDLVFTATFESKTGITVTADTASREYNGTALTKGTATVTAGALKAGHTLEVSMTAASTITNAGSTANTLASVKILSGTTDVTAQYNITPAAGTLTINKKQASISVNAASKTYGEADPATFSGSVSGLVNSGDLGAITYGRAAGDEAKQNAGDDIALTAFYTENPNYEVTVTTAKLTINKRQASIAADNTGKTYGEDDPSLTATTNGVAPGETLNYSLSRKAGEDVGTYPITVTLGSNPNYNLSATNGVFTITASGGLSVSAPNVSVFYDGLPHSTAATALPTDASILYSNDNGATYTLAEAPTYTNAGSYTVYFQATRNGYTAAAGTATVTISPKEATISVENTSKTYGEADPAFSGSVSGLVADDDLGAITYGRAAGDEAKQNAGDNITLTASYTENPNYTVTVTTGKLTINKMQAAISVDNASKT
ncbi:MAG: InlB B-repeat-containing protein [Oscillospiraceae bacterium]